MPLDSERYKSACQSISMLTNLEVMLFDVENTLHLHIAPHDLPDLLEQMRQDALVQILQQPLAKEQVVVFHDALELKFLATSLWRGSGREGIIVVGPAISKILHPRLLKERSRQEQTPLALQKQLQESYETLPLIDEARQQAISSILINFLAPDLLQPQVIEASLSLSEEPPQRLTGMLEEHRAMIEKRYQLENNIFHAITAGDTRLLTQAMEQLHDISLPFQHASSPVRSLKNLALMGNALYRKAAEYGGVHPLHLDHISQTFAIQIEEARTIAELSSANARIAYIYCDMVKELSVAAFSPLIQEAITFLRVHLDQAFSLAGVAEALGVNPTYLSRLFTKETGMTFTDFLHHLRIEEAKYLLEHRTDSITAIASQVGFQDANYFARVFRKWEGMTPHEYRQR